LSIGLIALLDEIAALAKVAAASLDDVVTQAAKAGVKAAGVVVNDAAVTPRCVLGFVAQRELPIVGRIATGSLRNKLLLLLPFFFHVSDVCFRRQSKYHHRTATLMTQNGAYARLAPTNQPRRDDRI